MRRYRNAKIVATLGPASDSPEAIRALFEAGADVFRLNFSHGSHAGHAKRIAAIRALEAETGRPIGILTEEGDVYIAIYRKPAPASALETANAVLGELMGKQVVVRGRVFDAAGVKVIEISIASEM